MNAIELAIDRDCENIFALFNPVAVDLRFVISVLKINSDMERIGDYADGIANYVLDFDFEMNSELAHSLQVSEMFDCTISIVEDVKNAFSNGHTKLARTIFTKDDFFKYHQPQFFECYRKLPDKQPITHKTFASDVFHYKKIGTCWGPCQKCCRRHHILP